jgi:uncharacterized protein
MRRNDAREERAWGREIRLAGTDSEPRIAGYAAVFNELSQDLGGFRERIAPGAFESSLSDADVRALFNHDPNIVLGRTKAGTLSVMEDSRGLAIEISPPDTAPVRDLLVSIRRGDVSQMSFGFYTRSDKWNKVDDEWVRTLLDVELLDVSPVTFPAYPQTSVAVRSLERYRGTTAAAELIRRRLELLARI